MQRATLVTLLLATLLPTAAAATEVKAMGGFFAPDTLDIVVGEEVVFTNDDSMPHTVTSTWDSGGSFDAVLRGGESFSWTFEEIGDFVVHCRPHAYPNDSGGMEGMAMTITVGPLESVGNIGGPINETPGPGLALALIGIGAIAFALRPRRG